MLLRLSNAIRQQGPGLWLIAVALLAIAALTAPFINPYYLRVLTTALMFGYLAAAWNLVGGYGGQMSLGHAIFFGVGSYSVALLAREGIPAAAALPVAIVVSAAFAWCIAAVCFRYALRGIYFAVGTLLLAEIARMLAGNSEWLGRSQGLQIAPGAGWLDLSFASDLPFFYLFWLLTIAMMLCALLLEGSKLGYDLVALREQEDGAQALGVNVNAVKRRTFVLSAALTSIAGVIYGGLLRFVEPGYDLSLSVTLIMVMGAVLGGRGTALGPFVGGLVVVVVQEALATIGSAVGTTSVSAVAQMIYGLFFVVILLAFPRGIIGQLQRRRADRRAVRLPPVDIIREVR